MRFMFCDKLGPHHITNRLLNVALITEFEGLFCFVEYITLSPQLWSPRLCASHIYKLGQSGMKNFLQRHFNTLVDSLCSL